MRLSPEDLRTALATLPGWSATPEGLRKQFHLRTYADAVAALVRIGFEAEALNHHPEVHLHWKRVTFILPAREPGGITDRDIALARRIEGALGRL